MVSVDQVDKVREKIVSGRYFQFQFSSIFLCCRCSANPCKKGETQARSRQCLDRSETSVLRLSLFQVLINPIRRTTGEEVDLSACSGRGQRRAGDRIEIEPCFCF